MAATIVLLARTGRLPAAASNRNGTAALTAAAAAFRSGRYAEARQLIDASGRRHPGARATVIAARSEMALGLYPVARARLEAAIDEEPRDLGLRRALCDLLGEVGDRAAAKPLLDLTYDDWSAGRVDLKNADDLVAVAAIVRLDDNWQDANETLRAAVRADPKNPEPNVLWGDVFLEKHAVTEAETSFRAALAIDPDNPDARVGLATVLLQNKYDVAAAERELGAALHVNPRHAGALAVRAEMAMDGEDFDTAQAIVAEIRRTNAHDARAAWLSAARARLLDDDAGYRHERDAHAAFHPADGDFFAAVADILVRHRRTADARDIAKEGTEADPPSAHCQAVLATTLLRLGDEVAGVLALKRAWKRDPYDARTYNLLELYEKVVSRMQTFTTKHLAFRVDPGARAAIALVVAPFLEETYVRTVAKYGFEPKGPITFELYGNPEHYAIRTVGLPGLGVDAVCFGQIITSQSPVNGALNWGMVLTHELAHVFAIELSKSRVPRWFTEGLSELETMRARPEWRRHADRDLWGAMARGELAPLGALSNAFVRARGPEEGTRAYAEAAAALDYLDRRFGFARIRDALVRFGRGERGPDVVAAAMGVPPDELERGFRADLAARCAAFDHQYLPAETLRMARPAAEAAVIAASPSDRAAAEARLGLAQLAEGDIEAAARSLARAGTARIASREATRRAAKGTAQPLPGEHELEFLAGELALARRQAEQARRVFLRLLAEPNGVTDGYDLRVRLALAEIHRHDLEAAEAHLKRAIAFDPESAEATGLLVELLGDPVWHGRRDDERLHAIAATLRLEPLHAALAKELVFGLERLGRSTEVIDAATLAIFIEPGLPSLHIALGRALASTGDNTAAAAAWERALQLGSSQTEAAEIRRFLSDTYLKLGDPGRAAAIRGGSTATGP